MELKVISWNIWGGRNRQEVIDYLKLQNADIIALQEITIREKNGHQENDVEIIAKELGYHFYFSKAFTTDRHFPSYSIGNALLSKSPIHSSQTHILSDLSTYEKNSTTEPRIAVECVYLINNIPLHVYCVHLGYSETLLATPLQEIQLEKILSVIPNSAAILMGDFNSIPESTIIKKVQTKLVHTDKNLERITWTNFKQTISNNPEENPKYRIDYIFTTNDLKTTATEIGESEASDHFPVIANIQM
jgi:endonuclease/exonuclease/phosphatase family metal-dependent hydrolase